MAEQLLNREAASQNMSGGESGSQQFRQSSADEQKSYNSAEQHQTFHPTQQSFNEQKDNYSEQAFNTPSSELSEMPEPAEHLPYDRKLERLTKSRDAAVKEEQTLYDSLHEEKGYRVVTEKSLTRPYIYTGEEVADKDKRIGRILKNRKADRNILKNQMLPGGRLVLQKTKYRLTKSGYEKAERKEHRGKYIDDAKLHVIARKGRLLFDDTNISEDEFAGEAKRKLKRGLYGSRMIVRENVRNIRKKTNKYERLKTQREKEELLNSKIVKRRNKVAYHAERSATKGALTKEERRKKMQQARLQRKKQEGNFLRRARQNRKIRKKSREMKEKAVKKTLSVVFSAGMIVFLFFFLLLFGFTFFMAVFQGTVESYTQTVIQVDYGVMSDCTSYYRKLETDLEEKLQDKEALEAEIMSQEGNDDIYEFVYNLADIGFDSTTLMAYLGAKYVEFTLEDVQAELDELFALNYILHIETKMEYRTINDVETEVKICYITLEKVPLEDIVTGRLDEAQLNQYNVYKMSDGGQQVYGPVMETDWTNLITSNFGERIHPITGERTRHNGVDIGIPTGTPLYSAVKGTVIFAGDNGTAGNCVKVQNSTGWTVIFMHMDSVAVSQGDILEKGDFVGYSGNTGRSTGPHLHLEVRDTDNNPVNPIFIVPQTCVITTTREEE